MNTQILLKFQAGIIFSAHFVLVLIVAVGWLVPGLFYLHTALLAATIMSEILFGYCVLTRLEFGLRKKLNPDAVFDRSCIAHYTRKWRGLHPRPAIIGRPNLRQRWQFTAILVAIAAASFTYNMR